MEHSISIIILQLAAIIFMTKLIGDLFRNTFGLPRMLGEFVSGIIIGPFLLGGIALTFLGGEALFPLARHEIASPIINNFANFAAVIFLFVAGLETHISKFSRLSNTASLITFGGFIASFFLGALTPVVLIRSVTSLMDPPALMLGTLAAATSVSISSRILTNLHKMSTSEATTLSNVATLDNVFGIFTLTIVLCIINIFTPTTLSKATVSIDAIWMLLFTLGISALCLLLAPRLVRTIKYRFSIETCTGLLLSLALIMAFLTELSSLTLILGGYIAGLALSRTDITNELRERLQGIYQFFVPIFFATAGMMINLQSFLSLDVVIFALIFSAVCIFTKIIACGSFALLRGFRIRGALRIGVGMIPQGEMTVIIASTGFVIGALNQELFAATFITILFTNSITLPLLKLVFRGAPEHKSAEYEQEELRHIHLELPSASVANFLADRILDTFNNEEYFVNLHDRVRRNYQIRKDTVLINLEIRGQDIDILFADKHLELIRLLIVEALVELQDIFTDLQNFKSTSILKDIDPSLVDNNTGEDNTKHDM